MPTKTELEKENKHVRKRQDSWSNVFQGFGNKKTDPMQNTVFTKKSLLGENTLCALYTDDGVSKRIADLPIDDMTRAGFKLVSGDDSDFNDTMQELALGLNAWELGKQGLTWNSVFGGCVFVFGLGDGGDLEEPLNEANIDSFNFIHVFDRYRVRVSELDQDENSSTFGEPLLYEITPIWRSTPFKVHESRTFRMNGLFTPARVLQANDLWGTSVYQAAHTAISRFNIGYVYTERILADFIQVVMQIKGLQDKISAGRSDEILDRLKILDLSRSIFNTMIIDEKEQYDKKASNVSGLDKILDRFGNFLSSVVGIPLTLLLGQSPAGLDATGDADIRIWYDKISARQKQVFAPYIKRVTELLMLANGVSDESFSIEFNPLWQPTELEQAETYKLNAEGDEKYVDSGAVTSSEIRESRFGDDSSAITLDSGVSASLKKATTSNEE